MATAAFLAELRRADLLVIPLVRVTLAGRILRLAPEGVNTPDGARWDGVLVQCDPIAAPGSYFSTGPDLCTTGFRVSARAVAGFQAAGQTVDDLFAAYSWLGAKVEIIIWPRRLAFTDAATVFTGIILSYRTAPDVVDVKCIQRSDWQRMVSPAVVTRDKYPRAPDKSVGKTLPIFYGAVRALQAHRPPWTYDYGPSVHHLEHVFGGPIGMPLIQVDTGRGGSKQRARYLIAGHPVRSHNDPQTEITTYFVRQNELLVPIAPPSIALTNCSTTNGSASLGAGSNDFLASGVKVGMPVSGTNIPAGTTVLTVTASTVTMSANATGTSSTVTATFVLTQNNSEGAGFELTDDFKAASYPIAPEDVLAGITAPGDDLRHAIDPSDVSFAHLVYQPSPLIDKRRGEWILPDVPTPGDYAGLGYIHIAYRSSATLTNFVTGVKRAGNETFGTLTASTTPTVVTFSVGDLDWGQTIGAGWPQNPWAFSESTLTAYWSTPPAARQDVYIYFIGLEVVYRPKLRVFKRGYTIRTAPRKKYASNMQRQMRFEGPNPDVVVLPDVEVEAEFYGTAEGYADDGSGTFTGVAAALIERPCDIANHLLRTYAGQAAGQVETGGAVFGSFVDARTNLKTWNQRSMVAGLQIYETSDIDGLLKDCARAGAALVNLDRFTDKWLWVPWARGSGSDYGRPLYADDLINVQAEVAPANRVPSGVRVLYAYDSATRQFSQSCHVSINGSGGGQKYQDIRDEQPFLAVADVNDRLDFALAGFNGTAQLDSSGLFNTGHEFAKMVRDAMVTAHSDTYMVGYGTTVETGYNDKLDFNDGANRTATVAAAGGVQDYGTMEALCAAVQTAMNAVSSNWSCTYDRSLRKVIIDRSSGTKNYLCATGANKATSIYSLLGIDSVADRTGVLQAPWETEEERFHLECLTGAMDLLFQTGTYGADAVAPKNCAELLGFTAIYDRNAAGAQRHWVADCPRNQRERWLAEAASAYGQTREVVLQLDGVYETDTAREVRNRFVDGLKAPPVYVRLTTTQCPDLHRGELIQLPGLDSLGVVYPKGGSNGLWTGKRFRVLSVRQRLGPTFEQEIEAVEND